MAAPEDQETTRKDWETDAIEELMVRCLEAPDGPERDSVIEEVCRQNPESKAELLARLDVLKGFELDSIHRLDDPACSVPDQLGDFKLGETLGQGGMGIVFRAQQVSLKREVAVKVLRPGEMLFPGSLKRFRREVETMAKLEHPGIARVISVGDEDGLPFFAMECLQGKSLGELVKALAARSPESIQAQDVEQILGERLPPELRELSWIQLVLHMGISTAEALGYAHGRQILHRDVKPSNIMLTNSGRVVLLDFGLTAELSMEPVTRTGARLGTLQFMSPQQMEDPRKVGPRDDLYSLAATLVELLTLRAPFLAQNRLELERTILRGERPPLRARNANVSLELERVLAKALDIESGRRYASAEAFAEELRCVRAGRPVQARAPGLWNRGRRYARGHKALVLGGLLGFWLALGTPLTLWWQSEQHAKKLSGVINARETTLAERNTAYANLDVSRAELAQLNASLTRTLQERDAQLQRAETLWQIISQTFGANDPDLARGKEASASELLEAALVRVSKLEDRRIRGELRSSLSDVLGDMGQALRSAQVGRLAIEDLADLEPNEAGYGRLRRALGNAHFHAALSEAEVGDWAASLASAEASLASANWTPGSLIYSNTKLMIGRAKAKLGQGDQLDLFRDAVNSLAPDAPAMEQAKLASVLAKYLAEEYSKSGDPELMQEALGTLDNALEALELSPVDEPYSRGILLGIRGQVLAAVGRPEEALVVREEVLLALGEVLEPNDVRLLWTMVELAGSLSKQGQWERAHELSLEVLGQSRPGEQSGARANAILLGLGSGLVLHHLEGLSEAVDELLEGVTRDSGAALRDPAFHCRHGELLSALGKQAGASEAFDKAAELCDSSARGRSVLREVELGRIRVALQDGALPEAAFRASDFLEQHGGMLAAAGMGRGYDVQLGLAFASEELEEQAQALREALKTLATRSDALAVPRLETRILGVLLLSDVERARGQAAPLELQQMLGTLRGLGTHWTNSIGRLDAAAKATE